MKLTSRFASVVFLSLISSGSIYATTEALSQTKLSAFKNEKVENTLKVFGGYQQSSFMTNDFTAGNDNYSSDRYRISHFQIGVSIPSGDKFSIKPIILLGTTQADQSIAPQNGVGQRSARNGKSFGAGLDADYALFGTTFDLKLGASYRYIRNKGGILDTIKSSQGGGGSMEQNMHTAGVYLSPSFTNKYVTLSMNLGTGIILQEYVSGLSYYSNQDSILNKNFLQMGASAAYNF